MDDPRRRFGPGRSADQWRQFVDTLAQADGILARSDITSDPQAYVEQIDMARERSQPRARMDALFRDGSKAYPDYAPIFSHYANVLMPNLFGARGELQAFADSLTQSPGGEAGSIAYSFVAERLVGQYSYPRFFVASGISWEKTKDAFAVREHRYGLNNNDWNLYCYLAMIADDHAAAKLAYDHFGTRWDPSVWGNARYFYTEVLPWIYFGS